MLARSQRKTDLKVYTTRRVLVVDPTRFIAEMARHDVRTNDEIAAFLGTDRTTISRLRRGETLPSNGFLAACTATGVNYIAFLEVQDRTPKASTAGRAA